MVERSLLVEESDLVRFINENWRGFDTKDYELLAAVLLARLHKKKFGETFHIALPLDTEVSRHVPNEYTYENLKKAISFLKEDSPVDIGLVPETVMGPWPTNPFRRPRLKSQAFQLKRVAVRTNGDFTGDILRLLSDIQTKYAPIQAGLVIVIGGGDSVGQINLSEIKEKFSPTNFPFQAVFFMTAANENFFFGQLWPNFGFTTHQRDSLFEGISVE